MRNLLLKVASLPGLPRPLSAGATYEAAKSYMAVHGQPQPILIDSEGLVWAGGTQWLICHELGIEPWVKIIEDGPAAAYQELATRDLTVLETADLVLSVSEGPSINIMLGPEGKRSVAVSAWFRTNLGREYGYSPSQVENYARIARSTTAVRDQLSSARTLGHAMKLLRALESPAKPLVKPLRRADVPTAAEQGALENASAFMEACGKVDLWTEEGIETLRGLRDTLGAILKFQQKHVA